MRAYAKRHYQDNKADYLERNASRHALITEFIRQLKAAPCADCRRTLPPYCMDFDHKDGTLKLFNIASAGFRGRSKEVILAEIAKCDVICAVCHRIRTHNRKKLKVRPKYIGKQKPRGWFRLA